MKRLGAWPRIRFPADLVEIPAWLEYVYIASYGFYAISGIAAVIWGIPGVSLVTLPWYVHVYGAILFVAGTIGCYAFYLNIKRQDGLGVVWLYVEAAAVFMIVALAAVYFGSIAILVLQGGDVGRDRVFLAGQLLQQFLLPFSRVVLIGWELKKVYARRRELAEMGAL